MQTVTITGGSAGIGRAVAEIYARRGCRIGLIARGEEGLEAAAADLRGLGAAQVATASVDVAEASQVEPAAARFEQELGPLDVWVNDAMTTVYAPFIEMEAEEFERVTRVVYLGAVNGTRAALQRMRPRRAGAIVNVGSGLAYQSIPLQSAYCGAKFAIRGFTESVRAELKHDRLPISLSMVHLPGVNTPQFDWARNKLEHEPQPAPPIYQPEVAARAIVKAADEGVRELFVGKSTLQLFLGSIMAPGFMERMMAASAYDAQQSDEQHQSRPDNLFTPTMAHHTAHGRFDDRARSRGVVMSSTTLRRGTVAGGALMTFLIGACVGALLGGREAH